MNNMAQNGATSRERSSGAQGVSAAQRLEAAKGRYQKLVERTTRVKIELQANANQLAQSREEAEKSFGVSDLEGLRARYTEIEQKNDAIVDTFLEAVDREEKATAEVEAHLGA